MEEFQTIRNDDSSNWWFFWVEGKWINTYDDSVPLKCLGRENNELHTTLARQPGNVLEANCIGSPPQNVYERNWNLGWLRFCVICSDDFWKSHLQHDEVETKTPKKYAHPEKTTSWNPHKRFSSFENALIRRDTYTHTPPHLDVAGN